MKRIMFLAITAVLSVYANAAVLTGVTISDSSGFAPSYPASNLVDGLYAANMGWADTVGDWVVFDLGTGGKTFSKVRITAPTYNGGGVSTFNPTAGTLQFSDDGTSWSSAVAWSASRLESSNYGLNQDWSECAMASAVTTRYVKFTVTNLGDNPGNGGRIGEFQFIDSPQLAVWSMGQGSIPSYLTSYPTINTADNSAATFAVIGPSEAPIYDLGVSQSVSGFMMQARPTANLNPTSGQLWVSDSPTSGWTQVGGTWSLASLAGGAWGTVDLGTSLSGRYVKLTGMNGQYAEIKFLKATDVLVFSSSGFTDTSYPADNMVNGIYGTSDMGWATASNAWVIFKMGQSGKTFSKVRIAPPRYGGSASATYNPTAGTLEFSNDNITWTSPISWNSPALESVLYGPDWSECAMSSAITAKYVRLTLTTAGRIGEFQFIESPQLAVWEMGQDSTYTASHPTIHSADNSAATFAVIQSGQEPVYDLGLSRPVRGFRMQGRYDNANLNPTSGQLWVSNSPTSGFTKLADWTLPYLGQGQIAVFDAVTSITGRYVKLKAIDGQFVEFEVPQADDMRVSYPVTAGRIFQTTEDKLEFLCYSQAMNFYRSFDWDYDGKSHVVLDLGAAKNVGAIQLVNRLDVITGYNPNSVKIYVAANEAASGFDPSNAATFATQIYNGQFLPMSNAAGAVRQVQIPSTTKRYFMLEFVDNLNGVFSTTNDFVVFDDLKIVGLQDIQTCADKKLLGILMDEDLDQDCDIDNDDLKLLADRWLECTVPGGAGCFQTKSSLPTFSIAPVPAGGIQVNGDLSDWPSNSEWIWLNKIYSGYPADINEAKVSFRWDGNTDKIYAAIIVYDADHKFKDTPTTYNDSDRIEIYSQGDAAGGTGFGTSGYYDIAQQYMVGPKTLTTGGHWATWANQTTIAADAQFESAVAVNGNQIIYEIGIKQFDNYGGKSGGSTVVTQLSAGITVGLDIIADTLYNSSDFGMLAENTYTGKWDDASKFQQYTLVNTLPSQSCGDWGYLDEDISGDCKVNLADFAMLAQKWLTCDNPVSGSCFQN